MAQSKQSAAHEDKVLECSICLSDLIKPKQLPCLHNFCLKCLKDHCDVGKRACPVCHREFIIPEGGVEMLKNNEFMERLVLEKELREGKKAPKCELCQEIGEDVNAEAFCVECSQRLCRRCGQLHLQQTFTRLHRVVDIKEMLSDKDLQRMRPQYCTDHNGKEIELYCCDCERLLCSLCHSTEHNKHVCKVIRDIAKLKKEILLQDQYNLKKQSGNLDELQYTELNGFILYSGMVMEKGTDCEIVRVADDLHRRAEELIRSNNDQNIQTVTNLSLKYLTPPQLTEETLQKHFGSLELTEQASDFNSKDIARQLVDAGTKPDVRTIELKPKEWICGVTVLDDQIVLLRDPPPGISFYDSHTLNCLRQTSIPGMEGPAEITGCSLNKALYIVDYGPKLIHCVKLSGVISVNVICWEVKNDYSPHSVSITLQHNVLVTMQTENTSLMGDSLLAEYTSEGQLIREIKLDRSIEAAWHTVQLSTDKFVITYGKAGSRSSLCVVNSKGQIIKSYRGKIIGSYGGKKGGTQLDGARALVLDRSRHLIYVSDKWNKRVLKFKTDLTLIGEIDMGIELYVPSRLCFDPSTDRLLVGDNPSASNVNPQGKPSHLVIVNCI